MHRVESVAHAPVVYEIAPFRNIWILRRRGSPLETLYVKRQQAIDRAAAMCRMDDRAEMIVLDAEPALRD
ncbi:MAG: hypothetical protein ACREM1_21980 [Longimicrobiales bacterium]